MRPLNNNEKNTQSYNRCLKQESAQSITWIGSPETHFTFNHVACETVDQETLFRVTGLPMVENCIAGYNSCIFAYGQEEESRRDENLKYSCKCSFLEIYNEQITDLLEPSSSNLLLREDIRNGVYVDNLTESEVGCVSDIINLLTRGSANRKVAATKINHESSRSHSAFTCIIESRLGTSGAEGELLKEAVNINKSLSSLGNSRLTSLLQDSLGGNSKTMIIGNVSPSVCSTNEPLSTLQFAQRARHIQNNAVINAHSSCDKLALQHQKCLLEEIACLKHQGFSRCSSCTSDRSGGAFDGIIENVNMDTESKSDAEDRRSQQDLQISNNEESSFVAKDQADELTVATKSLEHALLSISLELDAVVSDRHLLEGQIEKGNEEIAALKVELVKKIGELNMVSTQNAELKSKLKNSHTMKKELADKIEATGRLEVDLLQLRSLIEEKNSSFQSLQNNLSKLAVEKQYCKTQMLILQENEDMASKRAEESVAIARESQQIAEKREEYVKLLERSIDYCVQETYIMSYWVLRRVAQLNFQVEAGPMPDTAWSQEVEDDGVDKAGETASIIDLRHHLTRYKVLQPKAITKRKEKKKMKKLRKGRTIRRLAVLLFTAANAAATSASSPLFRCLLRLLRHS
ncbi:hypothetical protein PR202_ga12017 [Eleusine coracana subsp. coracana]|uniref:Kinesin motor domain-containing protein n=1 Tax=Eleusine coracana subsp. coracana TaxID=191504 RepID=A0AAV5CB25_ELECO|nr:hypothetical protein PR202_ga12017 [Eleusine coracana subsp. coracana]